MATALEWQNTDVGMRWSLTDAGADKDGKHEMQDGLLAADVNRMAQVKNGFHKTQRHSQGARDAFDNCARENQGRLYNMGRAILGLGPV